MKKHLLITILCLMFAVMISCADEVEEVPEYDAGFSETDLDGYEVRIMQDEVTESILHYAQDSLFSDLVKRRVADIEKAFNCKVEIRQHVALGSAVSYVTAQIATNSDFADIYFGSTGNAQMAMARAGYLVAYDDLVEYIDYTNAEKFGSLNLLELAMYQGKFYTVLAAAWPNKLLQGNVSASIAFNENIIAKYSMPNPRELHETQEWTTANFTNLMKDYYVKEGETEIFAFMGHPSTFMRGVLGTAGMKLATKVDGKWVPSFDTKPVLDILEWARDYATVNDEYIRFLTVYTAYENLIRGETTTCIISTNLIDHVAYGLDNFGLLPFPSGPDIEYGKQLFYFSTLESFCIFGSSPEHEGTAMVLNALLEPFEGYETEEDRNAILFKTVFYNQDDVDYFASIYDRAIYQYFNVGGYRFMETMAEEFRTKPASEIIGQLSGTMDSVIENYIAPNYEIIYQ